MSTFPNDSISPQVVEFKDLDHSTPPEPPFLIDQLVPANATTLLAAHGGTGKTTLAMVAAVCLAAGLPFLGHAVKQSNVVFYSAEDDGAQLKIILSRICKAYGIAPSTLAAKLTLWDASATDHVLFCEKFENGIRAGSTTAAFESLSKCYFNTKSHVLIIDNASDVYAASEVERSSVSKFIRSLTNLVRSNEGAVILLSHIDKASAKARSTESYSGSTAWNNAARSRLSLSSQNGGLVLQHLKSNRGPLASDMELEWKQGVPVLVNSLFSSSQSGAASDQIQRSILALITQCNKRGESISVEPQARNNAFKMLKSENTFPRSIRQADQLWPVLRALEDRGELQREYFQDTYRKTRTRWMAVSVAPSAPSAPTSNPLDVSMVAQVGALTAPTSIGGMGEIAQPRVEQLLKLRDSTVVEASYEKSLEAIVQAVKQGDLIVG